MTIQFTCECGKALQAGDEHAGARTRCPGCGRELTIPATAAAVRPAPPPAAPAAAEEWADEPAAERAPPSPRANAARGGGGRGEVVAAAAAGTGAGVIIAVAVVAMLAVMGLVVLVLIALLLPAVQKVREAAARTQSMNNLRMIGLAMHNYHDSTGTLPAAAIHDQNGRPLLSWRVALLPYLDQEGLYRQFKLDEPWDSPHNRRLLDQMPKVYANPAVANPQPGHTVYRVFAGPGAVFDGPRGLPLRELSDGASETLLVAEAADGVPWTKPDELSYGPGQPLPRLGGHHSAGFLVVLADGSVRVIPKNVSERTLRAAITRDGKDEPGPEW